MMDRLMETGDQPKSDRQERRVPVVIEIILDSTAGRRPTRISDLSIGGCYVESISSFRDGEDVAFEVQNSDGSVLRFTGQVVYVLEGFGFGMRFTNLNNEQNAFIERAMGPPSG